MWVFGGSLVALLNSWKSGDVKYLVNILRKKGITGGNLLSNNHSSEKISQLQKSQVQCWLFGLVSIIFAPIKVILTLYKAL